MNSKIVLALIGVALLSPVQAENVTLGADVTLNGTFFTGNDGWPLGTNALPSDLVSGVYQPNGQQWNFNSVWWNGADHPGNTIVVDLPGLSLITGLTLQADDNDTYRIEYWGADAAWHVAWDVAPPFGWGLQTSSLVLGVPIMTELLRISAIAGDGYYAVSQIAAEGRLVPVNGVPETPTTVMLLGGAVGLLALSRRFRALR